VKAIDFYAPLPIGEHDSLAVRWTRLREGSTHGQSQEGNLVDQKISKFRQPSRSIDRFSNAQR
jgi:hypothetical protein